MVFPAASAGAQNAEKWLTVFEWSRESLVSGASQSVSQERGRLGVGSGWKAETLVSTVDFQTNAVWGVVEAVSVPGVENTSTGRTSARLHGRNNAPRCWKRRFQTCVREVYRKLSVREKGSNRAQK